MSRQLRVLALQPYFGGSHAQFHNGWIGNSTHDWTTLDLPARHWKWRMRHAAIHFVEQAHALADKGQTWDVIVATDMMNIAELRGLLRPSLRDIPILLYFHENQFVYPNQWSQERDRHFPFTNFISAIAADQIWFNSQFNFDSMIEALHLNAKTWPDFKPIAAVESLNSKKRIQPPGIETPPLNTETFRAEKAERAKAGKPLRIIWAARWEHDKNPEALLESLQLLAKSEVAFELSVIGQTFRTIPPVFEEIKEQFGDSIVHWGFLKTRQEYWEALAGSDVFISTANHEFFGLSAAESIAAGTFALLPNRLAYPELLSYSLNENSNGDGEELSSLYSDGAAGLASSLENIAAYRDANDWPIKADASKTLLGKLALTVRGPELDIALLEFANLANG